MYRNWINARLLLEADKGGASGGDSSKVEESFQRALDRKSSDGVALAREMFDDNFQMRRKNKELSDELTALRGKVPAEGAVVLSANEAQAFQAYKALGTHDEVKTALEQRSQLQGQLDGLARDSAIRDAATAAGYKFSVLLDRDKVSRVDGKQLSYAVREVDKDGKKVPVAYVKDGDTEKPLAEYAQEQWGEFMPSLVVQAGTPWVQQQNGTPYPAQYAGTGGSKPVTTKEQAQATLDRAYARKDKK